MISAVFINNQKCTKIHCKKCNKGYWSPFVNKLSILNCICGSKTKYEIKEVKELVSVIYE